MANQRRMVGDSLAPMESPTAAQNAVPWKRGFAAFFSRRKFVPNRAEKRSPVSKFIRSLRLSGTIGDATLSSSYEKSHSGFLSPFDALNKLPCRRFGGGVCPNF